MGGGDGAQDPVRVVVVDDDALVRAGLRLILGGSPGIEVVGEAADGEEALTTVAATLPDVVLMDVRMPRLDGIAATRRLAASGSRARVVVLTTFDADEMVLRALSHGASGFLLKDTPPAELVAAVRRAAAGEPALSPSVTQQVIAAAVQGGGDERRARARARLARLTTRERAVADAVAQGLTNQEIGDLLHLSITTVKTHLAHVSDKLGATNRVLIARCVHDAGEG